MLFVPRRPPVPYARFVLKIAAAVFLVIISRVHGYADSRVALVIGTPRPMSAVPISVAAQLH
jgi:hypothetical protein